MRSTHLALVLAVAALTGCDGGKRDHKEAAADPSAIEKELKANEAGWEKDYQARDVDKAVAHYSNDAAVANPGMALASDEVSRKMAISQFLSDPSMKVTFASDRVGVAQSGEMAYTRGHYAIESIDPKTGKFKSETGSYLTVWKKQADGSWKAVEDAVIPGAATPAAEPAG
jgi:ketosteroid isomerase-like protein